MHFGIPRIIDTTETLHYLSLNLQTIKSKFLQHQDLELKDYYIEIKYQSYFFFLSIITNTKHLINGEQ